MPSLARPPPKIKHLAVGSAWWVLDFLCAGEDAPFAGALAASSSPLSESLVSANLSPAASLYWDWIVSRTSEKW